MVDERARMLSDPASRDPRADDLGAELAELLARDRTVRLLDASPSGADRQLALGLLEREPVHPPGGEAEAGRRLGPDRRVYVVEHPLLPRRPLNVLWVALCRGVPSSLGAILDADAAVTDPERADTAVLYSIWNAEKGLAGVGSGDLLVQGASEALLDELGDPATITTMSPVPGLAEWARARGTDEPDAKCCARYLVTAGDDGRLLDPVARFHLGNGARLWQLLPGADDSSRGLRRSNGWMVNYRYHPEDKAANRDALERGLPAVGPRVAELLGET